MLELAQNLLEIWTEFEGVSLKLASSSEGDNGMRQMHAIMADGAVNIDKLVRVQIRFDGSRPAVSINADRYFHLYDYSIETEPEISAEEAVSLLSPRLSATGEPELEIRSMKLLYRIPVTGVARVHEVFISALTGEYEWMVYEWNRQDSEKPVRRDNGDALSEPGGGFFWGRDGPDRWLNSIA